MLAYVALFTVLGWPWLRLADRAVPVGRELLLLQQGRDGRLICWILAWVAHALATKPSALYDAPINWPAPAQLTGSEHLLSSQIVAAPVWLLTGNATLAGTLTLAVSYPLAAFAMQRLCIAFGMRAGAAWVAGLAYALGPLCAPANLQVLQYPALWLPVVAVALRGLALRPGPARAAAAAAAFAGALFSSYYMAVLVALATAVTALLGGAGGRGRRRRALAWSAAAAAAAAVLLGLLTIPYLRRAGQDIAMSRAVADALSPLAPAIMILVAREIGLVLAVLAIAGTVLAWAGSRPERRVARLGLGIALVGAAFAVGPRPFGVELPWTPFAALAASPLGFFRIWFRFVVLTGFGMGLLAAAALDACARRRRLVWLLPVAAAGVLLERGIPFARSPTETVRGQVDPVYGDLAALAPPGPVLELPSLLDAEGDSMVGQTRHWRPLVLGHTGYQPPLRSLVHRMVADLPDPAALDNLAAVTDVRWLLLAPVGTWPSPAQREGIVRIPGLAPVLERDGWTLLRNDRARAPSAWRAAAARRHGAGRSALGVPLDPLDPARTAGTLRPLGTAGVEPGGMLPLDLEISNDGTVAWPAAPDTPGGVVVQAAWIGAAAAPPPVEVPLHRDVAPGERLRQPVAVPVPRGAGQARLVLRLAQQGGAALDRVPPVALLVQVRAHDRR